jgi:hypothetical protein
MSNRTFRVMIGDQLSAPYIQQNGVIQGAVLSVNLFLFSMIDITSCVRTPVEVIGFEDDWTIFMRDSDLNFIQKIEYSQ